MSREILDFKTAMRSLKEERVNSQKERSVKVTIHGDEEEAEEEAKKKTSKVHNPLPIAHSLFTSPINSGILSVSLPHSGDSM